MSHCFGPIFAKSDYAGFVRRTVALMLDGIILWAAWFAAMWGWYLFAPTEWVTEDSYRWVAVGHFLVCVLYLFGMRLTTRGTLGYRLMGIQYAYMLKDRPTFVALAFRALLAPLLMWFFALDHLWILVDKRKQAWHDKVTGFYVIKRRAEPTGTVQMVQRAINFMLLTFIVWEPAEDTGANAGQAA
jgi:uncharacterized RDD family membrane protein YckC